MYKMINIKSDPSSFFLNEQREEWKSSFEKISLKKNPLWCVTDTFVRSIKDAFKKN